MNYIIFGKTKIPYKIIPRKRKTTEILIDKSGVLVLAPDTKDQKTIHMEVQNHSKWIFKKQLEIQGYKIFKITYANKSKIPYLGRWYTLEIIKSSFNNFELKNGIFIASLSSTTRNNVQRSYLDWEHQKADSLIKKWVREYSKLTKLTPSQISIRPLKTKWGGISKQETLTINQKLIRAPRKIIDYVIIHELCHLKIPHHNESFWNMLGSIMPDYDIRKTWLRQNHYLLD